MGSISWCATKTCCKSAILTYARLCKRARLLVASRAPVALEAGHALLAWTLAACLVANATERADGVAIAVCPGTVGASAWV